MEDIAQTVQTEDPDLESLYNIRGEVSSYPDIRRTISRLLESFKASVAKNLSTDNKAEVRKGVVHWTLGNVEQAITLLEPTRTNKEKDFFLGICYLDVDKNSSALEYLSSAYSLDKEDSLILAYYSEALIKNNKFDEAEAIIEKFTKKHKDSADPCYLKGLLHDVKGNLKETQKWYKKTLDIDPDHKKTLFRLAYLCDIYGDDDAARELYEQLRSLAPCHVNTLLNLGIIYEDREDYERAIECYKTILESFPMHQLARTYLKDAMASMKMFYDEEVFLQQERERRLASQYIVELALPKRTKTALQDSGVTTLADLVKITEEELEQVQGLGQNGIRDIKEVLNSKGLSLISRSEPSLEEYLSTLDPKILEKPLSDLEWSGRNKKLFEKLGSITISDLVKYTEEELIKHKNVGATSIKEIKQKLAELSIELRKK